MIISDCQIGTLVICINQNVFGHIVGFSTDPLYKVVPVVKTVGIQNGSTVYDEKQIPSHNLCVVKHTYSVYFDENQKIKWKKAAGFQ